MVKGYNEVVKQVEALGSQSGDTSKLVHIRFPNSWTSQLLGELHFTVTLPPGLSTCNFVKSVALLCALFDYEKSGDLIIKCEGGRMDF